MKSKRILRILVSFVLIAVLIQSVCGSGADVQVARAAKKGISKSRITLISGKTERIKLKGDKIKSAKCDKKKIAKVSKSGVITAKDTGKAKITVTGKSGKKYSCKVIVKAGLNFNNKSLKVGESFKLKLNGAKVKKITSSNKSVASVKKSGKVTALKVGSTTIKVVDTKKKKYVCKVVVTDKNTKDNSNNSSVLNNQNASGINNVNNTSGNNTNGNNNNANNNNNSSGNTPNQTDKEYTVSILVDNCNNDYMETCDEKYVLSGSVETTGQISSVSCTYKGVSEEKDNLAVVSGTEKWITSEIPLKIGYNNIKFSVNMVDGKKYDRSISVLRLSTSLKMSDDVVEYDIETYESLNEIKSINDEILGTWTNGDEFNIAVSNSNPLFQSISEGKIKKDEIVYIPANQYMPYDVSLRYLYSDDNCSDVIEEYDSETCEVLHMCETSLFDMYDGDVAIAANTLDKEEPVAFVYSPYGDMGENISSMSVDGKKSGNVQNTVKGKGIQKENLFNFLKFGLDASELDNGKFELKGTVVLYDGDGESETENDQVKLELTYTVDSFTPIFNYNHGALDLLPKEVTGGMTWNEEVNVKVLYGAKIDLEDVVKELNDGFENKIKLTDKWTLEGVNTSDTVFLGAIGMRLDHTLFMEEFEDVVKEKKPVIAFSFMINLKGEAGIEGSVEYTHNQYKENGSSVFNKSIKTDLSKFKSEPEIESQKAGINDEFLIHKYECTAKSADNTKEEPIRELTIKVNGEGEVSVGAGAVIYVMCKGIIPVMVSVRFGPKLSGQIYADVSFYNTNPNKPGAVQFLNSGIYVDASGNANLKYDFSAVIELRVEIKAKKEAKDEKEYGFKIERDLLNAKLVAAEVSALKLKGHIYKKERDENGLEVEKPLEGATVSACRTKMLGDLVKYAVSDKNGLYEMQGLFVKNEDDNDSLWTNNTYLLEISADGYVPHRNNNFELSEPSDLEYFYDVTLEGGSTKVGGILYGARKEKNTDKIIKEPLFGAKVHIYDKYGELIKSTFTDLSGKYTFEDIKLGKYRLEYSADNYITTTQDIEVNNLNGVYTSMQIYAVEDSNETGIVSGGLYDATDATIIESNLTLYIYKDYNIRKELIEKLEVSDGFYEVELEAGNYTVDVKDENSSPKYNNNTFYLEVVGGTEKIGNNIYINPILNGELRAILRWGDSPYDLDLHVVASGKNSYHLYWLEDYAEDEDTEEVLGALDIDETEADGPETITIYEQNDGIYHILVHDYTNRFESYSNALALSGATVAIYVGDNKTPVTFNVPYQDGTLWDVCKYDSKNDVFIIIDEMRYIEEPDDIS